MIVLINRMMTFDYYFHNYSSPKRTVSQMAFKLPALRGPPVIGAGSEIDSRNAAANMCERDRIIRTS